MLVNRAGLTSEELGALQRVVSLHRTLEDVLRWGHAQQPRVTVSNVVIQDEYTHDVLVPLPDGKCLVYACT
ncbi:MAG: hypothetical protein AB2A00_20505 [Myxococcota bacterium]